MRKLLTLALGLLLIACNKEDAADTTPTPDEAKACVLQENAIVSADSHTTYKFTYDAQGKLLKREILEHGVLNRYNLYEYNSQQLIEKEFYFKADGTKEAEYTYAYNTIGLLTQMNSKALVNGTLQETFYCTYDYASNSKIARRNMWAPDGRMLNYYLYEYENREMRRVLMFNATGTNTQTLTLQYDNKLPVLYDMPALRKINWLMVGYPHEHNITSYNNASGNGQQLPDSYTATYEFNATGRPTKLTRQHPDGRQFVSNFTYKCQ